VPDEQGALARFADHLRRKEQALEQSAVHTQCCTATHTGCRKTSERTINDVFSTRDIRAAWCNTASEILDQRSGHYIGADGYVDRLDWLHKLAIAIVNEAYAVGPGMLHAAHYLCNIGDR
jgi:hypothetical protein